MLDDRPHLAHGLHRAKLEVIDIAAHPVPRLSDRRVGLVLQLPEVGALQGVVLAQLHLHFQLDQVDAVVEKLRGAVQMPHSLLNT